MSKSDGVVIPVLTVEKGQDSSVTGVNIKFPQTVECFSSLSHIRRPKDSMEKIFISLMPVCLDPRGLEEIK